MLLNDKQYRDIGKLFVDAYMQQPKLQKIVDRQRLGQLMAHIAQDDKYGRWSWIRKLIYMFKKWNEKEM